MTSCPPPRYDATPPVASILSTGQQALVELASALATSRLTLCRLLAQEDARDWHRDRVPNDQVLAIDAGLPRRERGMLRRVGRIGQHLPTLWAAVATGDIGFGVLERTTAIASRARLTIGHLHLLDQLLTDVLAGPAHDPDDLVARLTDLIWSLNPEPLETAEAITTDMQYVHVSPRLDGGEIHVLADATNFPLLVNAIDTQVQRNRLLDNNDLVTEDGSDTTTLRNIDTIGRARFAGLVAMATDTLTGHTDRGSRRDPVPTVNLTVTLDALTGATDQPAQVLDRVAGGRMRLTASATRQLVDTVGCDLTTTLVTSDGAVLGVGRANRKPPGWLSGLVDLQYPRCVIPGCRTTVSDRDHHLPWADGGATDLDNLAPLCRAHHMAKDRDRVWKIEHEGRHRIRITHVATGWSRVTRSRLEGPAPPTRTDATIPGLTRPPRRTRTRPADDPIREPRQPEPDVPF